MISSRSRLAKSKGRSRATNRISVLNGVDGRSTEARRYRDLIAIFASQFQIRSESDIALVRDGGGAQGRAGKSDGARVHGHEG
jgi:hypothetical protein